ncbi:glycosyltransferase family 4 protein [Nocardioides sp. W3-2-3]|nr:glycosyltransferase family 4 protein [Nocardioides convexus]
MYDFRHEPAAPPVPAQPPRRPPGLLGAGDAQHRPHLLHLPAHVRRPAPPPPGAGPQGRGRPPGRRPRGRLAADGARGPAVRPDVRALLQQERRCGAGRLGPVLREQRGHDPAGGGPRQGRPPGRGGRRSRGSASRTAWSLMPWLDDDAFQRCFAGAGLIVFPSDFEGFGLPAAEALRLGIPLVVSADEALAEVTGGARRGGREHERRGPRRRDRPRAGPHPRGAWPRVRRTSRTSPGRRPPPRCATHWPRTGAEGSR